MVNTYVLQAPLDLLQEEACSRRKSNCSKNTLNQLVHRAHVNSTPVTMVRSSFYHLFYFVFLFSNCILRITASHIPGESSGSSQEVAFFVFDHSELPSEISGDDLKIVKDFEKRVNHLLKVNPSAKEKGLAELFKLGVYSL